MSHSSTSADCGPPFSPRKGALESYTDTTIGSEVFYSCYQGLVPEGRMRTVCTRNGWSPNPAHLSCTVGTYPVVVGSSWWLSYMLCCLN